VDPRTPTIARKPPRRRSKGVPGADASNGYEAVAATFADARASSRIGADAIRAWAATLPRGASVLDLGCGTGDPVAVVLREAGLVVSGIDASPRMVAGFRRRLPEAPAACEAVEDSDFFGRRFDAVVAIGLVFLLPEPAQLALLRRVAQAIEPGGELLFTAPGAPCAWDDVLTGRRCRSLGIDAYLGALADAGFAHVRSFSDEGGNAHHVARRSGKQGA
jgi:2-polyprenyl-3-methyl-5-hydroxy-6-metoxy-1,4-benzoquinol methylase